MHMILKSDLKMAQASARCIPRLLLEDDCGHNHRVGSHMVFAWIQCMDVRIHCTDILIECR